MIDTVFCVTRASCFTVVFQTVLKTQPQISDEAHELSASVQMTSPKSLLARVDFLIGLLPHELDLQAIADSFPSRHVLGVPNQD